MDAHLSFHSYEPLHLHMGVCGSIASYKALELLRMWKTVGINVSVTLTPAACDFVTETSFLGLGADSVYTDNNGDVYAHLSPGKTAGAFVIVPATASTIARLACGFADELLSCQVLAFSGMPVVVPAMNSKMWENPATCQNIATLRSRGYTIVDPEYGVMACGDEGEGCLADLREVYLAGLRALTPQDFLGKRILITLGATHEYWDPVRFWGAPSTGIMGASIAVAAWLRGAEVHAVCGVKTPWLPKGIKQYHATTAQTMFEKTEMLWPASDIGIFTAAVADFSPENYGGAKFKKEKALEGLTIQFSENVDILKTLAGNKAATQKCIGFAAESENLEDAVQSKLVSKNADMIVGNYIKDSFGLEDNTVFILDKNGNKKHIGPLPKANIAWRILSWVQSL